MIKCVIVEDELPLANNLVELLTIDTSLRIEAVAENLADATNAIEHHKPELVFLDVVLGESTAFDLLDKFPKKDFHIVFTTAHSHFAIQAIRAGAFDYLLKPVTEEQIGKTLDRFHSTKGDTNQVDRYSVTKQYLKGNCEQIALSDSNGFRFVNTDDIVHIKAHGNYSDITMLSGEVVTITRQLKVFDEVLSPHGFCRIHLSHLVNLKHMKKYTKSDGGKVQMVNGAVIYISKFYKPQFLKAISHLAKI